MEKVKSAFEKAMEKAAEIGKLTPEEKERIKDQERLKSLLAKFYKGQLDRDGLWQRLKGSSTSFLKEAQQNLIDSMRLGSTPEEFQQRKDGVLAIETLKEMQNTSAIENILNVIEMLQKQYQQGKKEAITELTAEMERNPQLRIHPIKTPDGRTVFQAALSVDEAVQAKLADFLSGYEKKYNLEFNRIIEKLKKEVK
jgi:hypothetical protein